MATCSNWFKAAPMVQQAELPVGQSMSNFGSLSAEAEHKENDFVDLRGMGCVLKKFCFAAVAEFKVKENDVFPIRQHHEDPSPI